MKTEKQRVSSRDADRLFDSESLATLLGLCVVPVTILAALSAHFLFGMSRSASGLTAAVTFVCMGVASELIPRFLFWSRDDSKWNKLKLTAWLVSAVVFVLATLLLGHYQDAVFIAAVALLLLWIPGHLLEKKSHRHI